MLVGPELSAWYESGQTDIGLPTPEEFNHVYAKGVNTGLMFMDLSLMREWDWTSIWIGELNSGRFSKEAYLKVCVFTIF
jgi:hypothetical protein